jgi:hypothetical protein
MTLIATLKTGAPFGVLILFLIIWGIVVVGTAEYKRKQAEVIKSKHRDE